MSSTKNSLTAHKSKVAKLKITGSAAADWEGTRRYTRQATDSHPGRRKDAHIRKKRQTRLKMGESLEQAPHERDANGQPTCSISEKRQLEPQGHTSPHRLEGLQSTTDIVTCAWGHGTSLEGPLRSVS